MVAILPPSLPKICGPIGKLRAMILPLGLKTLVNLIDTRLSELLATDDVYTKRISEAMQYSVLAPGKRIRPALCMASAAACLGSENDGLDAGCAIEMLHCFSLIHDDLPALDNDDLRRGRPTLHKQYDEATAILAGDALFALCFEILSSQKPGELAAKAVYEVARCSGLPGLVGGEMLDILSEGQPIDAETLKTIHSRKTAALIQASCAVGALFGGGNEEQIEAMRKFGHSLGMAFQIVDDLLNETSTAEELGKATGSDKERGKATFPSVFGLEESKRFAEEYTQTAISSLEKMPGETAVLRELAMFTFERRI